MTNAEEMVKIETKQCPMCGKIHYVSVTKEQWKKYNQPNRPHIQDCFPDLTPSDREMLITGTCAKCWDNLFGGDE